MGIYSAAVQMSILTDDSITGIMPLEGSRPPARFRGTVTMSDSHAVNTLTVKVLRELMPAETLLLPCFCLQHPIGTTAENVASYLNVFTRVWTLSKTLNQGDFYQSLVKKMRQILEDPDSGLEVVDPANFELEAEDLRGDFTESIMDACWDQGPDTGEDAEQARKARAQKVREAFCSFFLSVGTEAAPCTRARLGVVAPRFATTTPFQSRGHVTTLKRSS